MVDSERQEEFAKLIAESESALNSFVYSLLPRFSDVEEVMQETLKGLWEHYEDYDPDRPFTPWACQFAYRNVLQFRRREATRRRFFSDALIESLAEAQPFSDVWLEDQRLALKHCMSKLRSEDQELIIHRYSGEKTIAEMSQEQGISANRMYKRLQRIRKQLVLCTSRWISKERVS